MRRWHCLSIAGAMAFLLVQHTEALIYLGEDSLESLLVRCPVIVVATVTSVDTENDRGVVNVEKTPKGDVRGEAVVKGVMRKISAKEKKARFSAGDRAILLMGQDAKTG